MPKPKRQCVYIKKGNLFYKIFWATVAKKDDSIMIGIDNAKDEGVLKIYDSLHGEMQPDVHFLQQPGKDNNFKITFHESGKIKVGQNRIKKIGDDSFDRCTIDNVSPNEIDEPKRMLEILLPQYVSKNIIEKEKFSGSDGITIDITDFPENHPLRCTVSCMSKNKFEEIIENNKKYVDTSLCESTNGLEFKNSVWVFTVRISKEDTKYSDRFNIFVPGKIKWPSQSRKMQ